MRFFFFQIVTYANPNIIHPTTAIELNSGGDIGSAWLLVDTLRIQQGNPNASSSSSSAPPPASSTSCGTRAKPKAMPPRKLAPRPKVEAVLPKSAARSSNVGQLSSQTGQLRSQTATDADHEQQHSFHLMGSRVLLLH